MKMSDELRTLLEKATPGPWLHETFESSEGPIRVYVDAPQGAAVASTYSGLNLVVGEDVSNAALIVFLRNHADVLLSALEWQESERSPENAERFASAEDAVDQIRDRNEDGYALNKTRATEFLCAREKSVRDEALDEAERKCIEMIETPIQCDDGEWVHPNEMGAEWVAQRAVAAIRALKEADRDR